MHDVMTEAPGLDPDRIRDEANRFGLPGVQLAHRAPDGTVSVRCAGRRNADGDPVTPETLFTIGSIGKALTALAAGQACDAGLATLDEPLDTHLDLFRFPLPGGGTASPSLIQLLSQSGGVMEPLGGRIDPASLPAAVRHLRDRGLLFPPGETMSWSNGGFILVGALLEHLTGERYEDLVRECVIEPLGLTHTALTPARALHHPVANDMNRHSFAGMEPRWEIPAGVTTFSTVGDLIRLAETLIRPAGGERRVVTEATGRRLVAPAVPGMSGYSAAYGFCPIGRLAPGGILYLSGTTDHGYADLRTDLTTGEVVVGLSQSPAVDGMLSALFPRFVLPTMPRHTFPTDDENAPLGPIEEFEGRYAGAVSEITVRVRDERTIELSQRDLITGEPRPGVVVSRVADTEFLRTLTGGLAQPVRFRRPAPGAYPSLLHHSGNALVRVPGGEERQWHRT